MWMHLVVYDTPSVGSQYTECPATWALSQYKDVFLGAGISIIKIRWPFYHSYRFIFIMGMPPILVRWHLHLDRGRWWQWPNLYMVTLVMQNMNKKKCKYSSVTTIYCHWYGTVGWNPPLWKAGTYLSWISNTIPDSKVHEANMGPTWVLSAPDGPHVGPMNFAIWDGWWWPGNARSQGSNSHGIDQVILEYFWFQQLKG